MNRVIKHSKRPGKNITGSAEPHAAECEHEAEVTAHAEDNGIPASKQPKTNTAPEARPHPAHCDHEHEAIAHLLGDALKRCFKWGRMEAA